MLPNIGFGEMVIVLALALLLFGAKRLPEVARGIGKSLNAFKKGLKEVEDEAEQVKSKPSVVIASSAPHRWEAFLACQYAIDIFEKKVSLWKVTFE